MLRPVLGSVTNLGHLLSISGIHCLHLLKEKIGLDKKYVSARQMQPVGSVFFRGYPCQHRHLECIAEDLW